jgi:hypothetical protein
MAEPLAIPKGDYYISLSQDGSGKNSDRVEQNPSRVERGYVLVGNSPILVRRFYCCLVNVALTLLLNSQWRITPIEQRAGHYTVTPTRGDDFFCCYSSKNTYEL